MIRRLIDAPRPRLVGVLVLLILVLAGGWAMRASGMGREPVPATAQGEFSAERARAHLERFATEPRPLGSAANDRTADYIAGEMRAAGFAVERQHGVGTGWDEPGLAGFGRVDNVIASLPGHDSTGTLLLAAHYDSVAAGPGASDDGAAVAAMLEVARLIQQGGGLRNDLVLLFTDGEEDGLLGAETFVREHPLGRAGGVVLNWEARGVSGPSLMFETSSGNAELVSRFTRAVADPRGDSSMVEAYRTMPNDTDFSVFAEAGFTGLNFAYIEQPAYYHTAGDDLTNLDPRSLQHHGDNMLALTRALGGADLPELKSSNDATYFRFGTRSVSYSNVFVMPLALLTVLIVGFVAARARRRELLTWRQLAAALGAAILPPAAAALLGQGLWVLLTAVRPGYPLMGGMVHRPQGYEIALAALAVLSLLVWYLPLRTRLGPPALAVGGLAAASVLGLVTAVFAPGASFLVTLPVLAAALGLLVASAPVRWSGWAALWTAAGLPVAAVLLPPTAGLLFDGLGLRLGGAIAALWALFGLLLLPVLELLIPARRLGHREMAPAPSFVALVAVVAVVVGLVAGSPDARRPRPSHLAYVFDADTGQARWVSSEARPTDWTREFVTGRDTRRLPTGFARGPVWTGDAEPMAVEGPALEVRHRDRDTVTMWVASRRAAPNLTVRIDHRIDRVRVEVPGVEPVDAEVTGVRPGDWPGEIRFRDVPPEGVLITVRTPEVERIRVMVLDESHTLTEAPGFLPRPADTAASLRADGDVVSVAKTYEV